jgi:hypothetical protein
MARRLEIVIFQIDKKDTGHEINEFIDAHAPVRSRDEKVRSETDLSIAHMPVRGVNIGWSDTKFVTRFNKERHLSTEISNAEGRRSHLAIAYLSILRDSRHRPKGGANAHVYAEHINKIENSVGDPQEHMRPKGASLPLFYRLKLRPSLFRARRDEVTIVAIGVSILCQGALRGTQKSGAKKQGKEKMSHEPLYSIRGNWDETGNVGHL